MYLDTTLKQGGWISLRLKSEGSFSRDRQMYIVEMLKQLPVIIYSEAKDCYHTSIYYYEDLLKLCEFHNIDIYVSRGLDKLWARFKFKAKYIKRALQNEKFETKCWTDKKENQLLPYQSKAANVCWAAKRFLNGSECGTGKTPEAIAVMCKAFENDYHRALVICLGGLRLQWKFELLKFTKFKPEDISIVGADLPYVCPLGLVEKVHLGKHPCRSCDNFKECKHIKTDNTLRRKLQIEEGKICIVHYDILNRLEKEIVKQKFDIFILDESTKIKNISTDMHKATCRIIKKAGSHSIVLPMSGTFIENRLEELFAVFSVTDKRIFGNFYNFKEHFLIVDHWGKVVGCKNEKRLKEFIDSNMIRDTLKSVWKERPPITITNKICMMNDQQKNFYDNAYAGALEDLSDLEMQNKINIANIGALINYLLQICGTTEAIDPEKKYSAKLDYLKEFILEELGKKTKLIIFSFFANKLIPFIVRDLKKLKVGKVLKVVRGSDSDAIIDKFENNNKCRFLVCSDTMAYGKNLQFCHTLINFDLRWNPAKIDQRIGRVYRRGQKHPVQIINLVTTGTIEDHLLELIAEKRELFSRFIGDSNKRKKAKVSIDDMLKILKGGS